MIIYRLFSRRIISAFAGTAVISTITAPAAYADDPLAQIKSVVSRDAYKGCAGSPPNFGSGLYYSTDLEGVAQVYARTETVPGPPPGYESVRPFLGAGDPEAQAITRAYQHGAGPEIGRCGVKFYGVGFVRHNDRSVDVVTIVFGTKAAPALTAEQKAQEDWCKKQPNRSVIVACGGVR